VGFGRYPGEIKLIKLEPLKHFQEIGLSVTGNYQALSIAHDHLAAFTANIFPDLFQVDQRGMMDAEKVVFTQQFR
jgi:hypothetical protein